MKRVGHLWPELTSFANLLGAAQAVAKGKRRRPDVAAFQFHLEPYLFELRAELLDGSYRPGPYRTFPIRDPKERLISAAPFRDRVVHHAFTRVVEPIFERRFSPYSFACRKGMGTHAALDVARKGVRHCRWPRGEVQADIGAGRFDPGRIRIARQSAGLLPGRWSVHPVCHFQNDLA